MQKRKWHFVAETQEESSRWYSALLNRLMVFDYSRRAAMTHSAPDTRLIAFLDRNDPFSAPQPMSLCDQAMSLDTISIIQRIIAEPDRPAAAIR